MNTLECSYLLHILQDHRDTIVQSWYCAIAHTSFVPLSSTEVRSQLVVLTDELIALLCEEPFAPHKARGIGVALARLHYTQPDSLGRTLDVLAREISAQVPPEQSAEIQPRLTRLLSELATGFCRQMSETILAQQERLRGALFTERKRVQAELSTSQRRMAERLEAERMHLARELHDSAVQQLLGISYQLIERPPRAVGAARELALDANLLLTLEDIRRAVLGVVSQLRSLIGELRPAGLEELGLTTALEGYVARLKREGGPEMPRINVDLDQSGSALPQSVALCLFRSAQEALRNALKHAHAREISVHLHLLGDEAVLNVHDDGCGFQVPARLSELAQADHFGLVGIAERVAWVGGRLTIRSRPAAGTDVVVRVGLNEAGNNDGEDNPSAAGG